MSSSILPGSGESEVRKNPRHLPSVDRLLATPALSTLSETLGRSLVKRAVQAELANARAQPSGPADPPSEACSLTERLPAPSRMPPRGYAA